MKWQVTYEGFGRWFVSSEKKSFECRNEDDAKWLRDVLNFLDFVRFIGHGNSKKSQSR